MRKWKTREEYRQGLYVEKYPDLRAGGVKGATERRLRYRGNKIL